MQIRKFKHIKYFKIYATKYLLSSIAIISGLRLPLLNLYKLFVLLKSEYKVAIESELALSKKINPVSINTKKYIIKGGLSGWLLAYSLNGSIKTCPDFAFSSAKLFSYWGLLLIYLDKYSDNFDETEIDSKGMHLFVSDMIVDTISKWDNSEDFYSGKYLKWKHGLDIVSLSKELIPSEIIFLTSRFCSLLDEVNSMSNNFINNKDKFNNFSSELILLMNAQLNSFNQKGFNKKFDIVWYKQVVLENKFKLFSPLFHVIGIDSMKSNKILNEYLDKINDVIVHRQILDDFIDIEEDMKSGILGFPAYILLMESRIQIDSGIDKFILFANLNLHSNVFKDILKLNPNISEASKALTEEVKKSQIVNLYINYVLKNVSFKLFLHSYIDLKSNKTMRLIIFFYYYKAFASIVRLLNSKCA